MANALLKRKRKFWMMLPVLVVPFLTFLFWKFGGGQAQGATVNTPRGLNLSLPDAAPENQDNWTKLDYYKKAEADSNRLLFREKKNPERLLNSIGEKGADEKEKKVRQKLAAIESAMQQQENAYTAPAQVPRKPAIEKAYNSSRDIEKLETMMQRMQQPGETDPELIELNKMLDKLVAIESPQQNTNAITTDSVKGLPVSLADKQIEIASEDAIIEFYGLPRDYTLKVAGQPLIKTIVAKNIIAQTGTSVPLHLISPLHIAGILLPAGTSLFAIANLQGNKLLLTVSGIVFNGQLLPVQLTAYDRTGVAGIAINNSPAAEFSRQSAQRSMSGIGFNSLNTTLSGQIAEAGLQTAKGLINKKVKVPTVQLRAGDEILLVDQSSKK